jgi:hypothetical protein
MCGSLITSCNQANIRCEKYKNGTFLLKPKNSNRELLIHRDDSIQVETDITSDRITKWKVKWDGCKYNLTLLTANFKLHNNMRPQDYSFDYEIIKQTERYYVYNLISSVFENDIQSDTIWYAH